jgi:hypothetical protein
MKRIIETVHGYGQDSHILWIYNQKIGDEFPRLFDAYWKVYETWNYHGEQVDKGATNFLISGFPPIQWKGERFGNYLYGSLLSVNFSWQNLSELNSFGCISFAPQERLKIILNIDGIIRHIFTALDAVTCCIFIVENEVKKESDLKRVHLSQINDVCQTKEAYRALSRLLEKSEFRYLSEYRNLITHRPFCQFKINKYSDQYYLYYLPNNLNQLDSITRDNDDYMQEDVASFMSKAFNLILDVLEKSLVELSVRYRYYIDNQS